MQNELSIDPRLQRMLRPSIKKVDEQIASPTGIGSQLRQALDEQCGDGTFVPPEAIERAARLAAQLRKENPEAFQ